MGFLSFNEKYYLDELAKLEGKGLSDPDLTEAKQILKVLDDLADEGYTALNDHLEGKFRVITRLRELLSDNGAEPFEMGQIALPSVDYGDEEFEVGKLCDALRSEAEGCAHRSDNPFLGDVLDYCKWIGQDEDAAYVFLFRDALLPYFYFLSKGRRNIHPWLISRAFLRDVTGSQDVDDEIRLPIYEALESGITRYEDFRRYCGERIRRVLDSYPALERTLKSLLGGIDAEKIIVVESGYCGTIPVMLSALDRRVDFRLYTTAPFLYETYRDRIFCRRYEQIRSFETLYSQDVLTKYSSFKQGKFYLKMAKDSTVVKRSLAEIARFVKPSEA